MREMERGLHWADYPILFEEFEDFSERTSLNNELTKVRLSASETLWTYSRHAVA